MACVAYYLGVDHDFHQGEKDKMGKWEWTNLMCQEMKYMVVVI